MSVDGKSYLDKVSSFNSGYADAKTGRQKAAEDVKRAYLYPMYCEGFKKGSEDRLIKILEMKS